MKEKSGKTLLENANSGGNQTIIVGDRGKSEEKRERSGLIAHLMRPKGAFMEDFPAKIEF